MFDRLLLRILPKEVKVEFGQLQQLLRMESLNEHWLIIRSCNLKHLQYVNMIARKKIYKKKIL